jgi:hypothetical protein
MTMVTLVFLLVIAAVFASVLALEGGDERLRQGPAGLFSWITRGNWPAKVGGALMIIGVGALLRYAALNLDAPPGLKLATGLAATCVLGVASSMVRRRAISLALGGSAFGVAYLTAYSAFALFGYLPTLPGLGLLALTAVGAGVFAVTRSAVSLAVLSMLGAFMAPAFAPEDPGAAVVYGYYVAVSLLTLCMVAVRGWRPLIHLSFLFTLAGGLFFAWTADYFDRQNAAQMLPLIAMLAAVHVAMPLLESRWQKGVVVARLDALYLFAVPVVSTLAVVAMSPTRTALAAELWCFAAVWSGAAAWLFAQKREGALAHALIGMLMLGLGLAARFRGLPWELLALAIAVGALVLAARREEPPVRFLTSAILLLGAVHIIGALAPAHADALFFNGRFFERLVGAALLVVAALTLRRLRHPLDGLMLTVGLGWTLFSVGSEVARLDLVSAWLLLHWALALVAFALFVLGPRFPAAQARASVLVVALGLSALLAVGSTRGNLAWISAIVSGAAMLAIALRPGAEDEDRGAGRLLAALGVPVVVASWTAGAMRGFAFADWHGPMACAAASGLLVMMIAGRKEAARAWFARALEVYAFGFASLVVAATVFDIGRSAAAVLLELVSVGALLRVARDERESGTWVVPALVIGIALVLQANLLRLLGPAGPLSALSVADMDWPTLVSLLWACMGAALTLNARRVSSRVQWSAGAAFLVSAAIKLILLDFGSLGQLANILAVIAAGGVFLLVGWLAPMPPSSGAPPDPSPRSPEAAVPGESIVAGPLPAAPAAPGRGDALVMPESYWRPRR